MKKTLLYRYLISAICLLLFFNNAKAICVTTFTSDTVNIACGDSFTFGGVAYYLPVSQTDTFTSIHGCDSVVTLHLNVTDTIYLVQGLCANDSIYFYGNWIKTIATYDTLIHTSNACDSLVTLNIFVVDPLPPTYIYDTICSNDSLLFNGIYVDTAGIYTAHINPPNACDSTVILYLAVKPAPVVTFTWDSLYGQGQVDSYYGDTVMWCSMYYNRTFVLSGGSPPGGYYYGTDISNDTFYASQVLDLYYIDTVYYRYTSPNGCAATASGIALGEMCVGIQEVPNQYILNLYPNPAHDYLTVKYDGFTTNSQIEIVDVLGRVVKTERIKGPVTNTQVDVHALSNGMYFLSIVNDAGVVSEGRPACRTSRFSVAR